MSTSDLADLEMSNNDLEKNIGDPTNTMSLSEPEDYYQNDDDSGSDEESPVINYERDNLSESGQNNDFEIDSDNNSDIDDLEEGEILEDNANIYLGKDSEDNKGKEGNDNEEVDEKDDKYEDEEDSNEDDEGDEDYEDDEDDDDDENDEDDEELKKLEADINTDTLIIHHPELLQSSYKEINALSKISRDKKGQIMDPLHRTVPFLTKYERARVLGIRIKQLNNDADPFIDVPPNTIDARFIAEQELLERSIPFIIRRPLPNGGNEYWKLSDLEVIEY